MYKYLLRFLDNRGTNILYLGAFAILSKVAISFMSLRPSVRVEQLGSNWTDFDEI